jgi:hypothetical protein
MATVSTLHAANQSARLARSVVNVPKTRTAGSAALSGTAA